MKFDVEWARNFIKKELNFHSIEVIGWNKADCGIAFIETRQVRIPDPTTINRFLICLHEICHISRQSIHKSMKVYEYEYDCEMYAIRVGLGLGLDIQDYEHRAKGYVTYCFCKAFNRNLRLDKANIEIIDWLGVDVDEWDKWDRAYVVAKSGWKKWKVNFYNV
jgi:hypothetical protein